MGVWIETGQNMSNDMQRFVTPFVGVWIETTLKQEEPVNLTSHPSWVCGLKRIPREREGNLLCHTLRGCVD